MTTREADGTPPTGREALLPRLALAAASLGITVLVLEGFARYRGVRPETELTQLSHELGWEWRPGYQTTIAKGRSAYRISISHQGLRNEEVEVPKPAGLYRIVSLGDSVTEGLGVELPQTFSKVLEGALREADSSRTVEVINAGTDGYGTEQELLWLRERGLAFEPDLVILNVYLNDSQSFRRPAPLVATLDSFLAGRSAFYLYCRRASLARQVRQTLKSPDSGYRAAVLREARKWVDDSGDLTRLIQAAGSDWGLAWSDAELARVEAGITGIARMAAERPFKLLVAVFPVDVQVYARVETPLDLDRPQKRLVAFARREGMPVVDLLPMLRDRRALELYIDHCHLTPAGHEVVAEALARAVRESGLGPPPGASPEAPGP